MAAGRSKLLGRGRPPQSDHLHHSGCRAIDEATRHDVDGNTCVTVHERAALSGNLSAPPVDPPVARHSLDEDRAGDDDPTVLLTQRARRCHTVTALAPGRSGDGGRTVVADRRPSLDPEPQHRRWRRRAERNQKRATLDCTVGDDGHVVRLAGNCMNGIRGATRLRVVRTRRSPIYPAGNSLDKFRSRRATPVRCRAPAARATTSTPYPTTVPCGK